MKTVGLVLEGGGMRGSYTLGILDVMLEKGIFFPYIIGVSAGACNAASYASRQHGRGQYIQETYITDPRYLSWRNLLTGERALYGMNFIFDTIPAELVPFDFDAYYAKNMHNVVVLTDVETGCAVYVENPPRETYNTYLRASSSIPMFAPVVKVDGHRYLDGGLADAIPYREALRHCEKVVVIRTRQTDYVMQPLPCKPLYHAALCRYPKLIQACHTRHDRYNAQHAALRELEAQGRAFTFYPEEMRVTIVEKDPANLHAIYEQGRRHALERLDELRAFLKDCDDLLPD